MISWTTLHQPVLLREIVDLMSPRDGGIYVDCNLGMGGHTAALLEASAPSGRVIGLDWDEDAVAGARQNLESYGGRVEIISCNFSRISEVIEEAGLGGVDGILLDLGFSSLQLEESGRGFSFQRSEPLDMRMDVRRAVTAADLLNSCRQEELADMFYKYGQERQSRRIAARIVDFRKKEMIRTTDQLVSIIEKAVPRRFHPKNIHVATKVFQALRIAVNEELDNLEKVLGQGSKWLKPGGRFCVISFHSLEDRLVKSIFLARPDLEVITRKPVKPSAEEISSNPRARSARLRVAAKK
ncbi:MAG: 16S rRNA (cytosine(1402)-N(4))-methyltransferase RsmH [Desulfurivibrionaceae bacterium]